MGNWVVDITSWVRANVSNFSSSAFAFQLPEGAPNPSVVIAPPIDGLEYDRELPDWYRGKFQAVIVSGSVPDARDYGNQILRDLTMNDVQVGSIRIVKSVAETIPIVFPKSDSDQFECSVTFNLTFVDTRIRTGT
ncbi:MAG: hypothetical protein NXH70_02590 [Hyphomonas sp.]|nr:hypothetical protein [Hyphomonas sp.]